MFLGPPPPSPEILSVDFKQLVDFSSPGYLHLHRWGTCVRRDVGVASAGEPYEVVSDLAVGYQAFSDTDARFRADVWGFWSGI